MIKQKNIEAIASAVKEAENSNSQNKYPVSIRNELKYLPVVKVSLLDIFLNPDNHRISAQLEDVPSEIRQQLEDDTLSEKSQEEIRKILRKTDDFKKLKEQIKDLDQEQPGLIYYDGLIVNGNTRYTALYDLKKEGYDKGGMMVAVLPESIQPHEIADIELTLQMRKLVHQDYTFTNELLFMKAYLDKNNTIESLAQKLNYKRSKKKKIEDNLGILTIIEEVRRLSEKPIPYSHFDDNETALRDLYRDYSSLINKGEGEEAEKMKFSRIYAMFLGISKDYIRKIDENFFESLVEERLADDSEEKNFLNKYKQESDEDDELLDIDDDGYDSYKLLSEFLSDNPEAEKGKLDEKNIHSKIYKVVANALEDQVKEDKRESRRQELHITLSSIRDDILSVSQKLSDRLNMPRFDEDNFEYYLNKIPSDIKKLREEFNKLRKKKK